MGPKKRSKAIKKREKDKQGDSSGLPGQPGYRTRDGRSGYDPIDTRTEAAHTAGTLLRRLFYGEINQPLPLVLSGLLGLMLVIPAVLAILEGINGNPLPWNAWIFLALTGIAGLLILVNVLKNAWMHRSRRDGPTPHPRR